MAPKDIMVSYKKVVCKDVVLACKQCWQIHCYNTMINHRVFS